MLNEYVWDASLRAKPIGSWHPPGGCLRVSYIVSMNTAVFERVVTLGRIGESLGPVRALLARKPRTPMRTSAWEGSVSITFENREVWQGLFNEVAKDKPAVGRMVRVNRGKHTGRIGTVRKHIRSRFVDPFRYGDSAQHHMTQARGRYGYAILVANEDGEFWTNADNVMVCYEEGR
jgi:hypothetical protein